MCSANGRPILCTQCYNYGTVSGGTNKIGGIVGEANTYNRYSSSGLITTVVNLGNVTGSTYVRCVSWQFKWW